MSLSRTIRIILILSVLAAVFVIRAYSLPTNVQFDSDAGRDSLFALRILDGDPTLLGPAASVGGFYLGPLLYYYIAVIFLLFGLNPVAVSLSYVLMGVAVVGLGTWLQKMYVSPTAALIFLLLATSSLPLVTASQSATNQPMMPLVTVLFLITYMFGLRKNSLRFDVLTGLVFGLFLHVHFSAFLIFIPLVPLFLWHAQGDVKRKLLHVCLFGVGILAMSSPVLVFDIRHGFITTKSLFEYIVASASGSELSDARPHLDAFEKLQLIGEQLTPVFHLTVFSLLIGSVSTFFKKNIWSSQYVQTLMVLSLGSLLLTLLYQGYLFPYYLLVPLTVWLLLLATLIAQVRPRFLGILLAIVISLLSLSRLSYNDKFRTVKNLSHITAVIEQDIKKTKPERFTVFKDSSDQMTGLGYEYRFLLARDGFMPHSEYAYKEADVLYYIREEGKADPLVSTHWETTEFGATQAELIAKPHVHTGIVEVYRLTR
ncbi:MAG: glycosyltransferase family 39 protein [bacterium]|nr:glycosyltransferase family 39 protein [bacterium]